MFSSQCLLKMGAKSRLAFINLLQMSTLFLHAFTWSMIMALQKVPFTLGKKFLQNFISRRGELVKAQKQGRDDKT